MSNNGLKQSMALIKKEITAAYGEGAEDEVHGLHRALQALQREKQKHVAEEVIDDDMLSPLKILLGQLRIHLSKKQIEQKRCHDLITQYVLQQELGHGVYDYGTGDAGDYEDSNREGIIGSWPDNAKAAEKLERRLSIVFLDQLCEVPEEILAGVFDRRSEHTAQMLEVRQKYGTKWCIQMD